MTLNCLKWGHCAGILSVLAAIGWWGHTSHWNFSHASEAIDARPAAAVQQAAVAKHVDLNNLPAIAFDSNEAARRSGIEITTAREQAMDEFVVAHGTVNYDQTKLALLSVLVPGVVWRVEKRVGDLVRRDDVLAIVDSAEVGQAKANLIESTVLFNLKKTTLQRLQSVSNAIAGREIEQAKADQQLARAQQFNALQRLINLGFPIQQADLENAALDVLTAKLQLLGLPGTLAGQTESTNLVPLVAPFDGIITQCHVVRGETVEPLTPQYVLANTERMWIDLDVRQEDVEKLRVGSALRFTSETGATAVPGVLTWIGTEIDPRTRTVRARGEVQNPSGANARSAQPLLRSGIFGSAQILVQANPTIVAVPNSALHWQWELERELVFLPAEDGRSFIPRVVTKGEVRDGWVHILTGLKPGDRVVSAGSRVLATELSNELQRQVGENEDAVRLFNQAASKIHPMR
jgi:cobalt-zinc-cadmium efflux system membrane fusion protein